MVLTCLKCQAQLRAPANFKGKKYRCAKCGNINTIGVAAAAVSPASTSPSGDVVVITPVEKIAPDDIVIVEDSGPIPKMEETISPSTAKAGPTAADAASAPGSSPESFGSSPGDESSASGGFKLPAASNLSVSSPPPSASSASTVEAPPSRAANDLAVLQMTMAAANKSSTRFLRWGFLLTLVPLIWHTFWGDSAGPEESAVRIAFEQKLNERLAQKPDIREALAKLDTDQSVDEGQAVSSQGVRSLQRLELWARAFDEGELVASLQEVAKRLDKGEKGDALDFAPVELLFMTEHSGLEPPPFLPEETWAHWGLGAVFAAAFLLYFCFAYPLGNATPVQLLGVGLFTGTLGILMLLTIQWLAKLSTLFRLRGRGLLVVIWLILVAIAFSYSAADDPENGFLLSFLGFTLGVGLLEELCKLLPVLRHYRGGGTLSWRGACVWGLVSGAGFGISEGIVYCSRYYNGSQTAGIYVVRFISCVAMHAAWAGTAAILMYRRREWLKGEMDWGDYVRALWPVILAPMILHGLYDTLLKLDMTPWALAVGTVSFILFTVLQEIEARKQASQAMGLLGLAPSGEPDFR